jgi:hypothetical protein
MTMLAGLWWWMMGLLVLTAVGVTVVLVMQADGQHLTWEGLGLIAGASGFLAVPLTFGLGRTMSALDA